MTPLSNIQQTGEVETTVRDVRVKLWEETRDGVDVHVLTLHSLSEPSPDLAARIAGATVVPTATRPPTPVPTPTPVTTFTDLIIWRFCSDMIAGEESGRGAGAAHHYTTTKVNKNREPAMRVVELVRA